MFSFLKNQALTHAKVSSSSFLLGKCMKKISIMGWKVPKNIHTMG